jgi:hypothetical protein
MTDPARIWNAVVAGEDTPCWPVTRRHERLKACASTPRRGAAATAPSRAPGRRRLTVACDAAGTPT